MEEGVIVTKQQNSKIEALADVKVNPTKKLQFLLGRLGNLFRNTENAGYKHFLLFRLCFHQLSFSERNGDFVIKGFIILGLKQKKKK